MTYVTGGQVQQNPPIFTRISKFFDGVIHFVMNFFLTLIPIEYNAQSSSSGSSSSRGSTLGRGGGGGGGGGWGGRPGPGGGGNGGARFRTMRDINPPTVGGCAGGSCGM
ncbi:H/ACA ribonucleoprotein complex subunit 1-like [Diabrotica virgifera virgifera]|uniref:H/ACA ribonucleoprotein complex subunit 1-like n=1 Tax=Diabrotica virgifera virgifera TaxID=50390 RepID=A0A6P7GI97_DIAVI|nr:H/ACA ribonucleoprotein complex subunit 1-like [Diabrotica virgifera virgifera]